MTYKLAANGVIHADGCSHADAVRYLWGGEKNLETAKRIAADDFDKVRVAPCAKKAIVSR